MARRHDYGARVAGPDYRRFLRMLHEQLNPQTYFEIGVRWGDTLRLANCASIAVDPKFAITFDVMGKKPLCLSFQETSDHFFGHRDPKALLGKPIEMAFLDGLHQFEFLLRDFINTERYCHQNSVIVLHDCLPPHIALTTRVPSRLWLNPIPYTFWWTGDVWNIVPVLKKYRPDLSMEIFDCRPSGAVAITGLDPASTVLKDAYAEIVARHEAERADAARFDKYWETVEITSTRKLVPQHLTSRYRLRQPEAATP